MDSSRSADAQRVLSVSCQTALLVCMGLAILVTVPGCGGCLQRDPLARKKKLEEEEKKKKKKPKPDFEVGRQRVQPRDPTVNQNLVKAGHWMTATQSMKANNFDFKGELDSASTKRGGEPFDVQNTAFRMRMSRPASLPKGQAKHFETLYFVPSLPSQEQGYEESRIVWLQNKLRARRGGREILSSPQPTTTMPHYQYFFVVLSDDPDRYGYLKRLHTVMPPVDDDEDDMLDTVIHYRVLLPKIENRVPLPTQPLTWTSIAYLLWDGMNPRLMTPPQQQAMLDWIHWGGQIVISGPSSLDTLRGSFLDKYLPAYGGDAISLAPSAFSAMDEGWSLMDNHKKEMASIPLEPDKPPVGIELKKVADAEYVQSTGDLVVERRVGRGRIVVTGFSLSDRQIVNWGSYDSFFNACLLRRPRRTFRLSGQTQLAEADWTDHPGETNQLDARFVTGLRYFARDVPSADLRREMAVADSGQDEVAGWNDRSGAADAARQSLKDAAGISVPQAGFVFRVLAVYLLVLAPVNWAVFRAIGRVEWAWVAAPVIAIIGAIAVVRLAQLDIGFARSRTEIATLEMHSGYGRGHLTRYTALYTSLSTPYDLFFDNDSAQALPFPHTVPYRRGIHESINTVHFRRDKQISLSGLQVTSNSTGLVHSEQMQNLGGSIDLLGDAAKGWMVRNSTQLKLNDVGVMGRNEEGQIQLAWIGSLEPAGSVPLEFSSISGDDPYFDQWRDLMLCYGYERQQRDIFQQCDRDLDKKLTATEVEDVPSLSDDFLVVDKDNDEFLSEPEVHEWCRKSRQGELSLGRLFELACQPGGLGKGEMRLVGWSDQDLPGITIHPKASQKVLRTMVLVHLKQGKYPEVRPDTNLIADFGQLSNDMRMLEFDQEAEEGNGIIP